MRRKCWRDIAGTRRRLRFSACSKRRRMSDLSIAIVIVSFNVRAELDACLASFVGHTDPFPTVVVVVDNGSTDGTAAMVRDKWPSVQLIESGGNIGFARANNLGIRATASEFVLLLNPD